MVDANRDRILRDIRSEFICPICYEQFSESRPPIFCKNYHVTCHTCIVTCMRVSNENSSSDILLRSRCASCRDLFPFQIGQHARIILTLKSLLNELASYEEERTNNFNRKYEDVCAKLERAEQCIKNKDETVNKQKVKLINFRAKTLIRSAIYNRRWPRVSQFFRRNVPRRRNPVLARRRKKEEIEAEEIADVMLGMVDGVAELVDASE